MLCCRCRKPIPPSGQKCKLNFELSKGKRYCLALKVAECITFFYGICKHLEPVLRHLDLMEQICGYFTDDYLMGIHYQYNCNYSYINTHTKSLPGIALFTVTP